MTSAPLAGCTVLVTRPSEEAGATSGALAAAGAAVIECPAIEFASLLEQNLGQIRNVLAALGERRGWLALPSPTAVRHFGEVLSRLHLLSTDLAGIRFTAIGEASAQALRDLDLHVDFLPSEANADSLAQSLPATAETPVLILGSSQSRPELRDGLARRGVRVQTLPLYAPQSSAVGLACLRLALERRRADRSPDLCLLLVTSPSAVDAIHASLKNVGDLLQGAGWVAIGPTTHRQILESGIDPRFVAMADQPRPDSVAAAAADLAAALRAGGSPWV